MAPVLVSSASDWGGPVTEGGAFRVLGGEHMDISLQVAASPRQRDQMHLDLYTAGKPREVQRLIALGATWVRSSRRSH